MQIDREKADFGKVVHSFPSLREAPMEAHALAAWLDASPHDLSTRCAAAFCLRRMGLDREFDLFTALRAWDYPHMEALFHLCARESLRSKPR